MDTRRGFSEKRDRRLFNNNGLCVTCTAEQLFLLNGQKSCLILFSWLYRIPLLLLLLYFFFFSSVLRTEHKHESSVDLTFEKNESK